MPQADPQLFHRTVEVALGVSLNAQSQDPDIAGVPSHAVSSRYAASLQSQALAPDIHLLSLRTYMEELLVSFNTPDLAPDDSYAQDRRCAPCIPRKGNHVLGRLLTKQDILHLFRQDVVCFHSDDFGGQVLDSQYAPRFFVDNLRKGSQTLARLHTKQVISYFFLQLVSQDSAQELFLRTIEPYMGFSRIEFQFCCLWTQPGLLVRVWFVFIVLDLEVPGILR